MQVKQQRGGRIVRRLTGALALALAPLVVGCSSSNDPTASHTASSGAAANGAAQTGDGASAGTEPGQVAPSFSLATLSGGRFAFPTGKPTAVWFTASGCRSCIPKAQALDRIKSEFGDRLAALGVDINPAETEGDFRDWLNETGNPHFEAALDKGGKLAVSWGVSDTSTVVITDSAGKVVYHSSEAADEGTFRDALKQAGLA